MGEERRNGHGNIHVDDNGVGASAKPNQTKETKPKGKERKGKESKGKERKGKERNK